MTRQNDAALTRLQIEYSRLPADGDSSSGAPADANHVVDRLRNRILQLRKTGITVRNDWLDGEQPAWCEIRGVTTVILDASATAAEQLCQLEEIVIQMQSARGRRAAVAANLPGNPSLDRAA